MAQTTTSRHEVPPVRRRPAQLPWPLNVYQTAVGKKYAMALIYIAANVALAIHIFHGAWSMFQSLGINNPKYNTARRRLAQGLAAIILIGNLRFPIAVQTGLIDEDNRGEPVGWFLEEEETE